MRHSLRPKRRFVSTHTKVALACSLALTLAGQASRAQANFTWNGPTTTMVNGALWSTPANWVMSAGTATTYPGQTPATSSNTEVANLNDTAANRIVTYDPGASGFLGTLNITETSGFNNEVLFLGSANASTGTTIVNGMTATYTINTLQINSNLTLGVASGTSTIFLDSYGDPATSAASTGGRQLTLKVGPGGTSAFTINGGGV